MRAAAAQGRSQNSQKFLKQPTPGCNERSCSRRNATGGDQPRGASWGDPNIQGWRRESCLSIWSTIPTIVPWHFPSGNRQ